MAYKTDATKKSEELYIINRLAGDSQRLAYRKAFPHTKAWKDTTIDQKAYALERQEHMQVRLAEREIELAERIGMSLDDIADRLEAIGKGKLKYDKVLANGKKVKATPNIKEQTDALAHLYRLKQGITINQNINQVVRMDDTTAAEILKAAGIDGYN